MSLVKTSIYFICVVATIYSFIDGFSSSIDFFTPKISLICSGSIVFLWVLLNALIKNKKLFNVAPNGKKMPIVGYNKLLDYVVLVALLAIWFPVLCKKLGTTNGGWQAMVPKSDMTEVPIIQEVEVAINTLLAKNDKTITIDHIIGKYFISPDVKVYESIGLETSIDERVEDFLIRLNNAENIQRVEVLKESGEHLTKTNKLAGLEIQIHD